MTEGWIELKRDCEAVQIPYGTRVHLSRGTEVKLIQELGGAFTVESHSGYLLRISADDADALDRPPPAAAVESEQQPFTEDQVWETLRTCYDPEIPINIVDLGLIYRCDCQSLGNGRYGIDVDMTLTAPGCGMGEILKIDVEEKLRALGGVDEVRVNLVFDPPWEPYRMSEAARLEAGMF
jgi:probable FeS assembly SUF system protein SufT